MSLGMDLVTMVLFVGRETILHHLSDRNCALMVLAAPPLWMSLWNNTGVSDNPEISHHAIVAPHNFGAICNNNRGAPQLPDDTALVSKADHTTSLASPDPGIQARVSRADDGAGWVPAAPGAESPVFAADAPGLAVHLWDALLRHRAHDSLGMDPGAPGAEPSVLGAVASGPPPQGAVATRGCVRSQHPAVFRDIVAAADHRHAHRVPHTYSALFTLQ